MHHEKDLIQTLTLKTEEDTNLYAKTLAPYLRIGDILTLQGDLGVGKTTFVQYVGRSLGLENSVITSPTFGLMHIYETTPPLFHYDLYRLNHPHDLYELNFEDAFREGITIIEWPNMAKDFLPPTQANMTWTSYKNGLRRIALYAQGMTEKEKQRWRVSKDSASSLRPPSRNP